MTIISFQREIHEQYFTRTGQKPSTTFPDNIHRLKDAAKAGIPVVHAKNYSGIASPMHKTNSVKKACYLITGFLVIVAVFQLP